MRNNSHLFAYPKLDKPVDNTQNSQGQNNNYQKPYQVRTYVLSQAQHKQFQNQKQQTAQQAADSSTSCPFTYDSSTRGDEGSSDDDAISYSIVSKFKGKR
ncbi:hypothetical protein F2Q70_00017275 [Brassica cretica]|uniref:Uncharacterized protein n=1 Tax=Brassica cretica TaxID=69181 RepID=A0A8S9I4R8_BRACR|nr:hypothetical protein F2Q70_00017275 [Brassica cretica]KAF2596884.1 hypothetical protein F2Q68_00010225 [Brassica cretica]